MRVPILALLTLVGLPLQQGTGLRFKRTRGKNIFRSHIFQEDMARAFGNTSTMQVIVDNITFSVQPFGTSTMQANDTVMLARRVWQHQSDHHPGTFPGTVLYHGAVAAGPPRQSASHPVATTKRIRVGVIGPGGGTSLNAAFYNGWMRHVTRSGYSFQMEVYGVSRAPYDVYPDGWQDGRGPPNLESFAKECFNGLADQQEPILSKDLLLVGSRAGQVVLPTFWRLAQASPGQKLPPTIVINGGAAAGPTVGNLNQFWPQDAVTLLLLGGRDYFTGAPAGYTTISMPDEAYLKMVQNNIPQYVTSTAILIVREMEHMPQPNLLMLIVPLAAEALTLWKQPFASPEVVSLFSEIVDMLAQNGWNGCLSFKHGDSWSDRAFGVAPIPMVPQQAPPPLLLNQAPQILWVPLQAPPSVLPNQTAHVIRSGPSGVPAFGVPVGQRHLTVPKASGAPTFFPPGTKVLCFEHPGTVTKYDETSGNYEISLDDGSTYPSFPGQLVKLRQT